MQNHLTLSGIGYFLDGYNLNVVAAFSFILVKFNIFHYSQLQLALVSGIALLGAVVGAILFGRLSDRFGRRKMYILYPLLFVTFPLLASVAWNLNTVIIARFFLGIAIGADYAVGPVYSLEMLPELKRGTGYGYIWAFWSLGAGISFFLGFALLGYFGTLTWRIVFAVPVIPAMFMFALRVRFPESNIWLAHENNVIAKNLGKENSKTGTEKAVSKVHRKGTFDLFRGDLRTRTLVVWIQWILLDIGSYGFNLYGPLIINNLGFSVSNSFLITGFLYILGFVTALISMSWNDLYGRKTIQVIGFAFMSLGMVFIALSYIGIGLVSVYVGILGLILWYGFENIGPGNTMGLFAMELFPVDLRSTSMGTATAVTRFVSFLSAFEFPFIVFFAGNLSFFIFLIIVMLAALIFTIIFTPETRGLTLDQISNAKLKRGKLFP
ncbi:MAG: sugar porter family MFS transporter [Candidatus Thermoplasmatota archaeon]|nr:sugar porter family MFS transporter [Candidatus Thermoplasmatota archaeon]